tara:strand:- start:22220 stop:23380 length:1161 start_codon:yes stop_codon:yes gene_type:complete
LSKRNKEIIHIGVVFGLGGVQSTFKSFIHKSEGIGKLKHSIWYPKDKKNVFEQLNKLNIDKYNGYITLFLKLIKKNVTIVWYNNFASRLLTILLRLPVKNKIILYERGTAWNVDDDKEKRAYSKNLARASTIFVNSQATSNYLSERFKTDKKKIKIIYNGVNLVKNFGSLPKKTQKAVIGYIGRLEPFKGVHTLAEAFLLLNDKTSELWIAGVGPFEPFLRKRYENNKRIKFLGLVENIASFYKKVSFVVVPSLREPLGNVVLEAGAYGKAVIATNVDGIPEIIDSGVSGILIEATKPAFWNIDHEDEIIIPKYVVSSKTRKLTLIREISSRKLAKEISSLIGNRKYARMLGYNLRIRVEEQFSISSYTVALEESLKEHLKAKTYL